jgi:sodium transport system permease protein
MDKQILTVFKKEFRELMRDRRVRSSAIIGPFLMVFMMMMVMGTAIKAATGPSNAKIHVVNPDESDPIIKLLRLGKVTIVPIASVSEGKNLLAKGKAAVIVSRGEAVDGQTQLDVLYDGKSERSQVAEHAVEKVVDVVNLDSLHKTLTDKNIPLSAAESFKVNSKDTTAGQGANELLLSMIPYLVVFLAFVGGVSAASDLVAGEKERNTLETLLISPVPRTKIVIGKFMTLGSICLLSSASGLVGILVAASGHLPGTDQMFKNGSGVTPAALGAIVLVMVPTAALFASVLIAVSSFAKNTREAQTYLSLGSIVVAIPSILSQFLGFTEFGSTRMINFIPILNASSAVRNALTGTLDATSLALTAGMSTAIALLAITIAVKLCNREEVLLRV